MMDMNFQRKVKKQGGEEKTLRVVKKEDLVCTFWAKRINTRDTLRHQACSKSIARVQKPRV